MNLTPRITLVPFLHGSVHFAEQIRKICNEKKFDCIAVDIPAAFTNDLPQAVDKLPYVSILFTKSDEKSFYIPIDPCDATIEAARQSRQNRIPLRAIGSETVVKPTTLTGIPDHHAIQFLGLDVFSSQFTSYRFTNSRVSR